MTATSALGGRIWMVGLMGSGKTTIGGALAAQLGWPYLDNDVDLVNHTGMSAAQLAELGGQSLHDQESSRLAALAVLAPPFVAGVAASVADRPDDLALLRRTGTVVYLRATAATLAARVENDTVIRPWVGRGAHGVLNEMLEARDASFLACAEVKVDVDEITPDEAVTYLLGQLGRRRLSR